MSICIWLDAGTLSDQQLLNMGAAQLQDHGVIFTWVTGETTHICCCLGLHAAGLSVTLALNGLLAKWG
jgi:N6-adenosine-specific RNA methylase IME4